MHVHMEVKLLYHVDGWMPTRGMGASGFNIKLYPSIKDVWKDRGLAQDDVNGAVKRMSPEWLKAYGWNQTYENDLLFSYCIRVKTGEWGIHHIEVPGNACGLDIVPDSSSLWAPRDGNILVPHNVDSPEQAGLLLTVFLFFMNDLMLHQETKTWESLS